MNMSLSEEEEIALPYTCGYFLKRLIKFHDTKKFKSRKIDCHACKNHGEKITNLTDSYRANDLVLYFRRYESNDATLWKCTSHFQDYVGSIIKIVNYCLEHFIEIEGFVSLVECSVESYLSQIPDFCCKEMRVRFVRCVARTMVYYKLKWLNNDLKKCRAERKKKKAKGPRKKNARKTKKTKVDKKLEKLTHN